jgi:SpoVK/Ycf46/Vps4 family AAA+-type ATPase
MGHFKLDKKFNFNDLNIGDRIEEGDFITHDAVGNTIQLKYFPDEDKVLEKYIVKPGVFKILKSMSGLFLEPTSFTKDNILESLISTKHIEDIIDCFFENIPLYKEFGIEIAKRNILVYGAPGLGKSVALSKAANKYVQDGRTIVVVWNTSDFEASTVKQFISSFDYHGVEKIILIAEDIGGSENQESRVRSDSGLLSLLDNNEKTFTIPVMVIGTTNYPQNLEGNLVNRSGRFDDKIEVEYPNAEGRLALLNFFAKEYVTPKSIELMSSTKCKEFSPASIREAYIRSRLRKRPLESTIEEMIEEMKRFNKGFSKSGNMGL